MVFNFFCLLVLWIKVASALEGLILYENKIHRILNIIYIYVKTIILYELIAKAISFEINTTYKLRLQNENQKRQNSSCFSLEM